MRVYTHSKRLLKESVKDTVYYLGADIGGGGGGLYKRNFVLQRINKIRLPKENTSHDNF